MYLGPSSLIKLKKNVIKVGPSLTNLSGSAHDACLEIMTKAFVKISENNKEMPQTQTYQMRRETVCSCCGM